MSTQGTSKGPPAAVETNCPSQHTSQPNQPNQPARTPAKQPNQPNPPPHQPAYPRRLPSVTTEGGGSVSYLAKMAANRLLGTILGKRGW